MNHYPLWRYILILLVLVGGIIYALPNLYGDDPAIQISARRAAPVDDGLAAKLETALAQANVMVKAVEFGGNRMLIRFDNDAERNKARPIIDETLDDRQYISALNLAPATPDWLRALGASPMYLGLDLRGGIHFLMQVDMDAVGRQAEDRFVSELRTALREEKIRYRSITREPQGGLSIRFLNEEAAAAGISVIQDDFSALSIIEEGTPSEPVVKLALTETFLVAEKKSALKQNLSTLRNRVNEIGVAEPVIQQQGDSRIVVELPGIEDSAEARKILGATATLEFRMVDLDGDVEAAVGGRVPVKSKLYYERNGSPILLEKQVMLTGEYVIDASSGLEQQNGSPAVFITLDGTGARLFSRATRDQIGKPMGVVYIELHKGRSIAEVINVATIRDELSKRFQISGLDSTDEARTLALLLRAGALAAPIEIVEERTVGPALGQENIDKGFKSVVIGFIFVLIFMALYYRLFGLIANIALTMNLVLIIALLSLMQATLTLPGIAGIVLTVGMAVDANVLIFQRIREEVKNGNSPQASIHAGYEKAFSTIADANITTFIAAIVLFGFGTGPIKGFAVTLSLGLMTSMFTSIVGTRAIVNLIYGRRQVEKLAV